MPWQPPNLSLRWGAYFRPAPEDEQMIVDMVAQAKEAGLITRRTAVERLSRQFGIEDIDDYVEQLEQEKKESDAGSLEAAQAAMKAMGQAGMKAAPGADKTPPPPMAAKTKTPPVDDD